MDQPILHDRLPHAPWMDAAAWRLPGVQPLDPKDWIVRDEVFAEQMALRDTLIAKRASSVHAMTNTARPAACECLALVLEALANDPDYRISGDQMLRPDGLRVKIDADNPLLTIGRLTQQDMCLMEAGRDGHILSSAILCFPASWTLSEKIGRPLLAIHAPVHEYDADLNRRVQRLFDAIRPDQPLWRANALVYDDPALFQPRRESYTPRAPGDGPGYLRSERQTLRRLPESGAVVFGIHTYVLPVNQLTSEQQESIKTAGIKRY